MTKAKPIDTVRLFGLTGVAMQTDLRQVEEDLGIHFRSDSRGPNKDTENVYYPQFEEKLRREAETMSSHYEIFYCLENSIRNLIDQRLREDAGGDWWNSKVPPEIARAAEERMQRDIDSGTTLRSSNPLDFTNFGELGEIIKFNWDLFGDTFSSKKAVEKVMANLNLLRGPIAHCSPLAPDETIRLQLTLRDWYRLME